MAAKIYLVILWLIASHNLAVVTSILESILPQFLGRKMKWVCCS